MTLPKFFTTVTPLSKVLAIFLFVSLPFLGYYLGNKYIPNIPADTTTTIVEKTSESWVKPISTDTIVPIVKDGLLNIYSLTQKVLQSTEYKTSWGSGASGLGGDAPISSPNGKLIAFINRGDSSNLYILAAGTQKAIKITNYPVEYLNSWSSDGSKILFYSGKDNLEVRKISEGMGADPVWETIEKFGKDSVPGFHVFNVNNGQDTHLYPVSTSFNFFDSNRIIVELKQDPNSHDTRLVLFNVETFEADYKTVNYPIKSFGRQMSFSADGKLWARTVDDGSTDTGVRITVSQFPSETGDIVETAPWAFIQKPLLNSSGRFLAYTKHGEQIKDGQYAGQYPDTTVIWDSLSKKIIKILPGFPEHWVDENVLLIGRVEYGNNPTNFTSFDLFNTNTGQIDSFSVK